MSALRHAVAAMRRAQVGYFAARKRGDKMQANKLLAESQRLEAAVDDLVGSEAEADLSLRPPSIVWTAETAELLAELRERFGRAACVLRPSRGGWRVRCELTAGGRVYAMETELLGPHNGQPSADWLAAAAAAAETVVRGMHTATTHTRRGGDE